MILTRIDYCSLNNENNSSGIRVSDIFYPRLLRRVQAVLIDSLVMPLAIMLSVISMSSLHIDQAWVKSLFFVVPILILEPGMVAFTGGTVGHHLLGIKVRCKKVDQPINFFVAIFRFSLKFLFGWLSLVMVLTTKKHQAIHDFLIGALVVHKSSQGLPLHESLVERVIEEYGYQYPAKYLRLLSILFYSILATVLFFLLLVALQNFACTDTQFCRLFIMISASLINFGWLFSLGLIAVFGWKARLYGCRRQRIRDEETSTMQ